LTVCQSFENLTKNKKVFFAPISEKFFDFFFKIGFETSFGKILTELLKFETLRAKSPCDKKSSTMDHSFFST